MSVVCFSTATCRFQGVDHKLRCFFLLPGYFPHRTPFYAETHFGWNAFNIGLLLVAAGLILIVTQALGTRYAIKRWGAATTLSLSFGVGIVHFMLMGMSSYGWMLFVVVLVTSVWFLAAPTLRGLMSHSVGSELQGRLQGAVSALATVTSAVAPLAASGMFALGEKAGSLRDDDNVDNNGKFDFAYGIVWYWGALLSLVGLVLSLVYRNMAATPAAAPPPASSRQQELVIVTDGPASLPAISAAAAASAAADSDSDGGGAGGAASASASARAGAGAAAGSDTGSTPHAAVGGGGADTTPPL